MYIYIYIYIYIFLPDGELGLQAPKDRLRVVELGERVVEEVVVRLIYVYIYI